MDFKDSLFARSPEPVDGNVLFYHLRFGTLEAIKVSDSCFTMPVTRKDKIIGYAYRNRVPEFMYQHQWFSVPYNGGDVVYRLCQTEIEKALMNLPFQIVFVNFYGSYPNAEILGRTLYKTFPVAAVSTPRGIDGGFQMKMRLPLLHEYATQFVEEFADIFRDQLNMNISVTIEPQTRSNWEF